MIELPVTLVESLNQADNRRLIEEIQGHYPDYTESFDKRCGCGACPRALRQTRVGEFFIDPRPLAFEGQEICYIRCKSAYNCGVCGKDHTLASIHLVTPK